MTDPAAFAAVDWGTSSFRLWLVSAAGEVLAERRSGEGMASLQRDRFAPTLEAHLVALDAPEDLPAVVCGMAGARQGWIEARYLDVPAPLEDIVRSAVRPADTKRPVHILPGLAQREAGRPDVMRGEETQLLGAASAFADTEADGVYCLPGTHSKWVRLEGGSVRSFSTFMTGELFAVIARNSILAHTVEDAAVDPDTPAFQEAVTKGCREPQRLTNALFSLRGAQLLFGDTPETAAARLSGLLIGMELACNLDVATGSAMRLVASGRLASLYRSAFGAIGIEAKEIDADRAVLHGLTHAARSLGLLGKA